MANAELQKMTVSMHEVINKKWATLQAAEEAFIKSNAVNQAALLINALAAFQIADKNLHSPKFKTLEAYITASKERLGVSRAYFFERMRIGAAYVQYRGQLYDAGYNEEKHASNLRLFFKAPEVHGTEKALKNLPRMSYREYQRWIMGKAGRGSLDHIDADDDGIRFEGELVISARQVARIFEDGEEPFMIGVRSDSEKRAVSHYLGTLREKRGQE